MSKTRRRMSKDDLATYGKTPRPVDSRSQQPDRKERKQRGNPRTVLRSSLMDKAYNDNETLLQEVEDILGDDLEDWWSDADLDKSGEDHWME